MRMLAIIITESKDVAEFARRAEAWASAESNPPTDETMAARWRAARGGLPRGVVVELIVHARSYRVQKRAERFEEYIRTAPTRGK